LKRPKVVRNDARTEKLDQKSTMNNRTKAGTGIKTRIGKLRVNFRLLVFAGAVAASGVTGYWAWAQSVPQPVLTIAPTGTNQFLIKITNAAPGVSYDLYRTPLLNNLFYPWSLSVTGALGQSNYTISMGSDPSGFWRAIVGWSSNGVPSWMEANPSDPSLGALAITIDSPTNGAVLP
jgi:hypothetical protein